MCLLHRADRANERLGVKVYGNQNVKAGGIVIRQRGLSVKPGKGIQVGKDYTLFAVKEGVVQFETNGKTKFVHVY